MTNKNKLLNVYNASAGAGKTYTLAREYITKMLETDSPNNFTHILAVTFTNKATAEMKDRILKYLFAIAYPDSRTGNDVNFLKDVKKNINITDDEIEQRAKKSLSAIMLNYDRFKVETIDSFFQSLLTSLAYELGLTRGFKVELNDKELIDCAVDHLLLSLGSNNNQALRKKVYDYLDCNMDEKEDWKIARELKKFANKYLLKDKVVNNLVELERYTDTSETDHIKELRGKLNAEITHYKKQREQSIKNVFDKNFMNNEYNFSNEEIIQKLRNELESQRDYIKNGSRTINSIIKYVNEILDGTIFKSYAPNKTIPSFIEDKNALSKKGVNEDIMERLHSLMCDLEDVRITYSDSIRYNTSQITLNSLNALSLLSAIEKEMKALSADSNTFLLTETPHLFYSLVKDEDVPFVFERLGTTLQHIMIDEFQDTSRKQFDNFKKLLSELMSNGNDCMLVGDIKQSIYRWRGGDWNILHNIEDEFKRNNLSNSVQLNPLTTNYRSHELIIRFNNAFFVNAAHYIDCKIAGATHIENVIEHSDWDCYPLDDTQGHEPQLMQKIVDSANESIVIPKGRVCMKEIYKTVEQIPKHTDGCGYIRVELVKNTQRNSVYQSEIMDKMYQEITQLIKQGIHCNDIAILVRRNKEGEMIIKHFAQIESNLSNNQHIPLTTAEAFMYSSSPLITSVMYAIQLAVSMHNYHQQEANKESKSDASTEKVFTPIYEQLLRKDYSSILRHDLKEEALQERYIAQLENFIQTIKTEDFFTFWQEAPLYEFVQHVVQSLHLYALDEDAHLKQAAYLYSFMDDVIAFVDDQGSSIIAFVEYWNDELYKRAISTHNDKAISIITIHKAKGLEKDTVMIPFVNFDLQDASEVVCAPPENYDEFKEYKDYISYRDKDNNEGMLPFIPMTYGKEMKNSLYCKDYDEEGDMQLVDNMNVLYVAFTRACNNLYVWTKGSIDKKGFKEDKTPSAFNLILNFVNQTPQYLTDNEGWVYEYGKKMTGNAKKEKVIKQDATKIKNPFDTNTSPDTIDVKLHQSALDGIYFIESDEAKDFMLNIKSERAQNGCITLDEATHRSPRERGILCHELFSRINTLNDLEPALSSLCDDELIEPYEVPQLKHMAKRVILECNEENEWFNGSYTLYNESDILIRGKLSRIIRPDRVMLQPMDKKAIVIDYKFVDSLDEDSLKAKTSKYRGKIALYAYKLKQLLQLDDVKSYLLYINVESNDGDKPITKIKQVPTYDKKETNSRK